MYPRPSEPELGSLLGRWRLLERVGSGGNGTVYRVWLDERPGDGCFALKLAGGRGDPRFEREAELLSRLEHPHVPRLCGTGRWRAPEGREYPYLVMQWVEGVPLYDWALQRRLNSRQVLRVLAQVARALEATHRHGVHRDVKGDNILVNAQGHAVLVDYGCCWYPGARLLTGSAVPPGTPPYRSPECLRFQYRHRMDAEAHYVYPAADDVYALGVTAYRWVTGIYPPPGTEPECADDPELPRPPRRLAPGELATVHPELEALIERMLSEEPQARGTASELAEALEKAASDADAAVDLEVKPTRSMLPTERATRPGPPRWYGLRKRARGFVSGAFLFIVVVVLQAVVSRHHGRETFEDTPRQWTEVPEARDGGGGDERVVGVADAGVEEGLASAVVVPSERTGPDRIGRELPKDPLRGQRKPPCTLRRETVIRGACWISLLVPAPCDNDAYEWEGRCYLPSFQEPRRPTSDSEK